MTGGIKKLEQPITHWLARWYRGDKAAGNELAAALEPFLHKAAVKALQKNPPPDGEPGVTTLLNEVWIRMSPAAGKSPIRNREHFMGVASLVMHNLLIDRHRGPPAPQIDKPPPDPPDASADTASTDIRQALHALEAQYPRQALVLLLCRLMGMTNAEIAEVIDKSVITVRRDLEFAEAYIRSRMVE